MNRRPSSSHLSNICTLRRLLWCLLTTAVIIGLSLLCYQQYQSQEAPQQKVTKPPKTTITKTKVKVSIFNSLSDDAIVQKSKKSPKNCQVISDFYKANSSKKADEMRLVALSWNYVWFDMADLNAHPTLKNTLKGHEGHWAKHSQIAAMFENANDKSERIMVTAETFFQTKDAGNNPSTFPICRQVQVTKSMKTFESFRNLVKDQEAKKDGKNGKFYDFKRLETLSGLEKNPTRNVAKITQKQFWRLVNEKYSGTKHIYHLVNENCNTFVRDMWKALTKNHEVVKNKYLPCYRYFVSKMKGEEGKDKAGTRHHV